MGNWPISRSDVWRRIQTRSSADKPRAARVRSTFTHRRVGEPGEMVLRSVGVALAVASTAFAAYMIADVERQPQFAGLEHLAIYARPNTSAGVRRSQTQIAAVADQQSKVDYTPVGSISEQHQDQPVPGFVLLGVRSGTAVIRSKTSVVRVARGDVVEGLGRIVSIERRGGKWVVLTTSGLVIGD